MCTLSWRNEEGLEVFFNRDELKSRGRAEPPKLRTAPDGTRYLSPIDPDAGGTWMLANEHGLILCLLNRWHLALPDSSNDQSFASRGKIVLALAAATSSAQITKLLPDLTKGAKPFELLAFSSGQQTAYAWDGHQLSPFAPKQPLTSSSFRFEEVKAAREKAFSQSSSLEQFQESQNESATAYTVRMNRSDAQTWSRSHLRIEKGQVTWDYWEEFPNLSQDPQLHRSELQLRS